MRWGWLVCAAACQAPAGDDIPPVPSCAVTFRGEPLSAEPTAWPDDHLLVADPSSPTGWRVRFDTDAAPWLTEVPALLSGFVSAVDGRSGFGRLGAAWLRFDGELPWTLEQLRGADSPVHWLDVARGEEVPVDVFVDDAFDGPQLRLQPRRPLRPGAPHLVLLERDGPAGCVSPGAPLWEELWAGRVPGSPIDWSVALEAGGWAREDVGAALHVTAHDDAAVLDRIADGLAGQPRIVSRDCAAEPDPEGWRHCELGVETADYRDETWLSETPSGRWTLPVEVRYRTDPSGPVPVLLWSHGMGADRDTERPRLRSTDNAVAVVGVDAMEHGGHPSALGESEDTSALRFLGVDLSTVSLDAVALRQHVAQSSLDRAQVVHALAADPDVDGDGVDDLDVTRVASFAESLGGVLSPTLVRAYPDVDLSLQLVAGGHLIVFVTQGETGGLLRPLLVELSGGEADLQRLLAIGQAAIDAGDPAVHAADLAARWDADPGTAPHVVVTGALEDELVPLHASRMLAQAYPLDQLEPVIAPFDGTGRAVAPVVGSDAQPLRVLVQYDRMGGDAPVPADHGVPRSPEGRSVSEHLVTTWLDGAPEVRDPYTVVGTPPLP